jgi:hypothetical protein
LALLNPGLFFLGPTLTFPLQTALGAWMLVLARWLWTGHQRLRRALLVTHGFLLLFGSFLVIVGFYAVAAAESSTGRGGGLLSPLAFLPFLCGVPLVIFALCSIVFALAAIPGHRLVPR